jgi:hypothetical protein
VFAPGNLGNPPPEVKFYDNRLIGALVLLIAFLLCLVLSFTLDSTVFTPYNATAAVTRTWQAAHPESLTRTPFTTRIPRSTLTPNNPDVNSAKDFSSQPNSG